MLGKKTGGRQKGAPNKVTAALKEMILGALDDAGGQAYLAKQAKENPGPFLTLLGKVLPTTIAGDENKPVRFELALPWLNQAIQNRRWASTPTPPADRS